MRCVECGGMMNLSEKPFVERFRGEDIVISGVKYFICEECGEIVLDAVEGKNTTKYLSRAMR